MSGHGNREISGLRFSLGSLTAFTWRPEGFWVFQNDDTQDFVPRSDRLINRFENNNYPDREGIEDELKNDPRWAEKDRIKTKDHLVKTWPPYERPVPPMFGIVADAENQDPKDHEGQFSGKKIIGKLKWKKPKDLLPHELAYPEEAKTDWFLHEPEHLVYAPQPNEFVENHLQRWIQHYILEYSNELRPDAPFLAPLRGEYSPAQWIAEFCQKAGVLAHESSVYPEEYQLVKDRVYKTRQFECSNGFDWWAGENLYFNSNIQTNPNDSIEDSAKIIARAVVDAWIASPPHYANLIRWREAKYKDLAMLDVGRSGYYYSQVFMGAPWWLQCGFCRWEGLESWQVLSWKTYENNRYREPFEERVYFKGNMLYERPGLIGSALTQSEEQCYLLVFILTAKQIIAFEAPFNPSAAKELQDEDFTEVCQHTIVEGTYYKKQSFFASRDGEKGITVVNWSKQGSENEKYIIRYANRQFLSEKVIVSGPPPVIVNSIINQAPVYEKIQSIDSSSSGDVACVDYGETELIVTINLTKFSEDLFRVTGNDTYSSGGEHPYEWELYTYDRVVEHSIIKTNTQSYSFNNINIPSNTYNYKYRYDGHSASWVRYDGVKSWYNWGPGDGAITADTSTILGPIEEINDAGVVFVDLRDSAYISEKTFFLNNQSFTIPFDKVYTRQKIDGPGHYPILPNLIGNYDYFYKHLLGCSYARYGDEWILSVVGYQIDSRISEEYELAIEVTSSTPVQYFLSSNPEITEHLNTLTKPFLVSVL